MLPEHDRGSCGKVIYSTQAEARVAIATMLLSRHAGQRRERRSYYCKRCRGWHLTKKPKLEGKR